MVDDLRTDRIGMKARRRTRRRLRRCERHRVRHLRQRFEAEIDRQRLAAELGTPLAR